MQDVRFFELPLDVRPVMQVQRMQGDVGAGDVGGTTKEKQMGACFDAACSECGARIGWFGRMKDRPPCPKCGHQLSSKELQAANAAIEKIKRDFAEDHEREWLK